MSNTHPRPTSTRFYLLQTITICAHVVIVSLLMQIPVQIAFGYHNIEAIWTNWLLHLLWFIVVAWLCRLGLLSLARLGLFVGYYSYFICSYLAWQDNIALNGFLLLPIVATGFIFTRHERWQQISALIGASLSYLYTSIAHLPADERFWLTISNQCFLLLSAWVIFYFFTQLTYRRWHQQKAGDLSVPQYSSSSFLPLFQAGNNLRQETNSCVMFADFQGYTQWCNTTSHVELMSHLSHFYQAVDDIAYRYDIEKIKTNGDQYMAATGVLNKACPKTFANIQVQMITFGLNVLMLFERYCKQHHIKCDIRIGIASGPCSAGVIGTLKPAFDIWGKTVNLAASLEQYSPKNCLHICAATAKSAQSNWVCHPHDVIMPKHQSIKRTFIIRPSVGHVAKDTPKRDNALWQYNGTPHDLSDVF